MDISYLHYTEIDQQKWNECIQNAANGLIYARAEYLNIMCEPWDALVLGEYNAVMPLTKRKKFGINYLYQPTFIQQGGIFGQINDLIILAFINKAKEHFPFAEINLNAQNCINEGAHKCNQIIDLNKEYASLRENYNEYTKRKLKKAENENLNYQAIESLTNLQAYKELMGKKTPHIKCSSFDKLDQFCKQYQSFTISRGIWINDELAASVIGITNKQRVHLLTLTNHNRTTFSFAAHVLIDQIIKEFSEQSLVLDFEGSDIPGVNAFNKGFGAINETYYFLKWNQLPWPLRWFK